MHERGNGGCATGVGWLAALIGSEGMPAVDEAALGRYRLLSLIGQGGMGKTYTAATAAHHAVTATPSQAADPNHN